MNHFILPFKKRREEKRSFKPLVLLFFLFFATDVWSVPRIMDVHASEYCEKGALVVQRCCGFGQNWDRPEFQLPHYVNYSGYHYLEVFNVTTQSQVWYYSIPFFVDDVPVVHVGNDYYTAYTSLGESMDSYSENPEAMYNVLENLDAGVYRIYVWSVYDVWGSGLTLYQAIEGSSTIHEDEVEIESEHINPPIDILSVTIDGQTSSPAPLYECTAPWSVQFELETVYLLSPNAYQVTASWAEVSNCGVNPSNYSITKITQLSAIYESETLLNRLLLPNLNSALDNSPFNNSNNIGKTYKIKFEIDNGVCPPDEVIVCVSFTADPEVENNLLVIRALNDGAGTSSAYQGSDIDTEAPISPYNSSHLLLSNSTGLIQYYKVDLDVVDASGQIITNAITGYQVNLPPQHQADPSLIPPINLNAINVPANATISYAGGTGFIRKQAEQETGYYFFRATVTMYNFCGDDSEWTFLRIVPDEDYEYRPAFNTTIDESEIEQIDTSPGIIGNITRPNQYQYQNNSKQVGSDILIYPVPFQDMVNLELCNGITNISILNANGVLVYEEKFFDAAEKVQVNTSVYPIGIYFYLVKSFDGIEFTGKFIKN
jgi:hypothetical protein